METLVSARVPFSSEVLFMQNVQTQTTPPTVKRSALQNLGVDIQLLTMLGALVAVWIGFQIWSQGIFLSPRNLWFLAVQSAVVGIMVGGMVLVIVARQIDLGVGSVLGFTAMIMGVLQTPPPLGVGMNWVLAMLIGIAVGILIGAFNGYLTAFWGVPAFVVTLAAMLVFRNGTFSVSQFTVQPLDETFQILGGGSIGAIPTWIFGILVIGLLVMQTLSSRSRRQKHGFQVRPMWAEALVLGVTVAVVLAFVLVMNSYNIPGTDTPSGIPVPVLIAIVVLGYLHWMTRATRFGRYIYAIGGNPEAANLAGINVKRMMVYIFMLMGFLTALAAAVQAARLKATTPTLGRDLELTVIAGAVIGGTVLSGGSGTILGAALGALLMSSLENGLGLVGVPTEQQKIYLGIVLLVAVLWNTVTAKRRRS
jgi:D-xylose transport system permease protein